MGKRSSTKRAPLSIQSPVKKSQGTRRKTRMAIAVAANAGGLMKLSLNFSSTA